MEPAQELEAHDAAAAGVRPARAQSRAHGRPEAGTSTSSGRLLIAQKAGRSMLLTTVDQELLQAVAVNRPDFCLFLQPQSRFKRKAVRLRLCCAGHGGRADTEAEIHEFTKIDPWFLAQFAGLQLARGRLTLGCGRAAASPSWTSAEHADRSKKRWLQRRPDRVIGASVRHQQLLFRRNQSLLC